MKGLPPYLSRHGFSSMPLPIYTAGFRQSLLETEKPVSFGLQLRDYFAYLLLKRFHRPLLSKDRADTYYFSS